MELAVEVARRRLEVARRRLEDDKNLKQKTEMTEEEDVRQICFCLKTTFFTFREVIYRQECGTVTEIPDNISHSPAVMTHTLQL